MNPMNPSGDSPSTYGSYESLWRRPLHLWILCIPLAIVPPHMDPMHPSGDSPSTYGSYACLWPQPLNLWILCLPLATVAPLSCVRRKLPVERSAEGKFIRIEGL